MNLPTVRAHCLAEQPQAIVLANRSIEGGALADDLGKHVVQRLTGKPAPSRVP